MCSCCLHCPYPPSPPPTHKRIHRGAATCACQVLQQPQYRGKALPADHPDSKLVQKIAERIIEAVEEGHGSGFQKHISKFEVRV